MEELLSENSLCINSILFDHLDAHHIVFLRLVSKKCLNFSRYYALNSGRLYSNNRYQSKVLNIVVKLGNVKLVQYLYDLGYKLVPDLRADCKSSKVPVILNILHLNHIRTLCYRVSIEYDHRELTRWLLTTIALRNSNNILYLIDAAMYVIYNHRNYHLEFMLDSFVYHSDNVISLVEHAADSLNVLAVCSLMQVLVKEDLECCVENLLKRFAKSYDESILLATNYSILLLELYIKSGDESTCKLYAEFLQELLDDFVVAT